jgi:predicted N-acyltransferase
VKAVAPLYAKHHSYGEYVFDGAWAQAYERAGLGYYPKLLAASPFSPIPGSRLLAADPQARRELLQGIRSLAQTNGLSSVHLLFGSEQDLVAARQEQWLIRENLQFHWQNLGYGNFEDYLSSLTQPKRKKIKAERRKVRDAGVSTVIRCGDEITQADWDFFYTCYSRTYREHYSTPYLSLEFFHMIAKTMPQAIVMCTAVAAGNPIASALLMRNEHVLYGRYWGAVSRVDCLHFEVAYYAPIAWAIEQGCKRFEGGAQGEHKLARGFTPAKTYSAHWLREPRFADAVARFLQRESEGIERYVNELEERSPIRTS